MPRDADLPEFDNRPSVRFSHTTPEHPKIAAMTDAGFRAWFDAICYCSRQETDGKITIPVMRRMASPRVIKELLAVGSLDVIPEGYFVHDYLRHQRSAAEIQSFRESKAASGQLGAHKRWHIPRRVKVKDCPFCLQGVASA